ncbi:transposase [Prosthecobacter dejongeii]|uniref:Transposase n=1 Tax=Prosthecobacter dejongeii TaxID=48465 RepID=A0A7W7YKF4_9BACT|nr:transposase [Prosthecobacter dejongeii]
MAAPTVNPKPPYLADVSDEEWYFCLPYFELMTEEALQRERFLRDVFNAVRYIARAGCPWGMLPHDWAIVYQPWQRWIKAGCMEAMAECILKRTPSQAL